MFNSNFRTGEGREQCAPTRYIDISLGDEARYVSGFLDIIIAFYNIYNKHGLSCSRFGFSKSQYLLYTVHCTKPVWQYFFDIGVIPDECHTCPSNFELCEPFQLNQMYMFEIYLIFLALICDR